MPSFSLLVKEDILLYMTSDIFFKLKGNHRVLELERTLEIA